MSNENSELEPRKESNAAPSFSRALLHEGNGSGNEPQNQNFDANHKIPTPETTHSMQIIESPTAQHKNIYANRNNQTPETKRCMQV